MAIWRIHVVKVIPWIIVYMLLFYGQYISRKQQDLLRKRGKWMEQVSMIIEDSENTSWDKDEEAEAWHQFFKNNPRLTLPKSFVPFRLNATRVEMPTVPK